MASLLKKLQKSQNQVHKRHVLTLEERVAVLKYLDSHPNAPMSEVCLRFSSNPRTLRRIQDKRESLLNLPAGDKRLSRTRFTKGNCLPVELCVLRWMDLAHFNKLNITNHSLQTRAKYFFSLIKFYLPQVPFLAASNGWINRFKVRNSIDLKKLNKESANCFSQELAPKRAIIQDTLSKYSIDDVFVLSTTLLFYSQLTTPSNSASRGSDPQLPPPDRLSLFLCSNASGTEKIFPSVVVPSGFYPEDRGMLHVNLITSNSGRIDSGSYFSWLESFNQFVGGRRIVLILDYAFYQYFSGASVASLYPNVQFIFLPQRHALYLQPFNLGITDVLKAEYRACLARETMNYANCASDDASASFQLSRARAVSLIEQAWSNVPSSTIRLSWKASGLLPAHLALNIPELDSNVPKPFCDSLNLQPQLSSLLVGVDTNDYNNLDKDGVSLTEAEILIVEEAVSYLLDIQLSTESKLFNCSTVSHEEFCTEPLIPSFRFDYNCTERSTHLQELPHIDRDYSASFPFSFESADLGGDSDNYRGLYFVEPVGCSDKVGLAEESEPLALIPRSIQIQNVDILLNLLRNQLCTYFDTSDTVTAALDHISQYVHRYD